MEFRALKLEIKTAEGWREVKPSDAQLSYDDLQLLARKFSMTANLRLEQDIRVSEWLQSKIAQAYAREQAKKGNDDAAI